jgi:type I restriction enzyme M protein
MSRGTTIQGVVKSQLAGLSIPLPPLEVQARIVAELDAERAPVEGNRQLVETFERKMQARLAELWGGGE